MQSGYSENPVSNFSNYLTDKKPIKTTGTTCRAFSARYESRHVFVKQLKPEYSSNPVYRSAFQKEYELGISLRHPSIPQYIKFTGDTLITEFVDGKTLHQMTQGNDPRLHSDRNIEKWVGQLLDVIDYLHARNVIHCDIKTDNIMITNDTRNLMLIDFDKAFTASQDLTPGTPLNFGSEDENLTKRQMDVRGIRNILENLLQYVDSESLKEKMGNVVTMAGSPEVTIPELLEIWNQHFPKKSYEKTNSKRPNIGWWLGGIILIALLVIVWSYLPRESSEVIQTEDFPEVENLETTNPEEVKTEEKKIPTIDEISKEEAKEEKKVASPDWNLLLTSDVVEMNKLLDQVSSEIKTGKIQKNKIPLIVFDISDAMNAFNTEVVAKYSSKFPELGHDKIMLAIYDSEPVKSLVKRRDAILQSLVEIQQDEIDEELSLPNDVKQKLESQMEKDLEEYMDFLLVLKESLDSTGTIPFGSQNTRMKLSDFEMNFNNNLLIYYPRMFPSLYLTGIEIYDWAYTLPMVKRMVELRDSILPLTYR